LNTIENGIIGKYVKSQAKGFRRWFDEHPLFWGSSLVVIFSFLRFIQTITWRKLFYTLDFQVSPQFILFLAIWFIILSVGLVIGGMVWLARTSWRQLGWTRRGLLKAIGLGLFGLLLLSINVIVWSIAKGSSQQPQLTIPSLSQFLLVAFFAFSQPAWVEENLFRGYLQPHLSQRMKLWLATVVQAAIFSLAHLGYLDDPLDFGQTFIAGLILGWLRGRQSNLVAPFVAHGLFWVTAAFLPAV
jgi:membrane protease YdiL (CAAX protease family)